MRKVLSLSFVLLLLVSSLSAQQIKKCGTMEADSALRARLSLESLDDFENWLQARIAIHKASPQYSARSRAVITIPVIVHVIHNGDAVGSNENISAAQVNSEFATLNEDFRKAFGTLGYNTNPVGADCEIEFCPAVVDPNGNVLAEPGIDRQNKGQTSWEQSDIDATLKPSTIWDPTRYCNIWTVNFATASSTILGYAQFPSSSGLQGLNTNGGSSATDGVVVRYNAFGRTGNVNAPYNKGRTTTHELGHWLGLRHIWGDQNCGNDYCGDTPTSTDANFGCPTGQNSCPDAGSDMIENYMDYTNDACMNLFTLDQKDRMLTVMSVSPRRNSLLSSNVCSVPFTFSYTGRVIDAVASQGIANAKVFMDGPADYTPTTDANGYFTITNLQQDNYTIYAGKWGYVTNSLSSQSFTTATPQITISLQPGYYEDYAFDFGWTQSTTATTGAWTRAVPIGTTFASGGVTYQCNPGADVNGDFLNHCFVTGNGAGGAPNFDVDNGETILTSPAMDLSSYTNPVLRYYRWFYNGGGTGTPNDSLVVSLVNGTTVIDIDKVGQGVTSNQWTYKSFRVKDYIANPGNNIYLRLRTADITPGHLVEGGIDLFKVIDSTGVTSQPPVANFASSITSVCAGGQVAYNDLSTNNPTGWAWTFQGGSPSTANAANPLVTYSAPGTYNVSLTVSNNGGTNTSTQTAYITVNSVVAQFSQDKPAICPGQTVIFTNETSCNPTLVKWIFSGGDIAASDSLTPSVSYSSPGYYDVTLITGNQFGTDTLVQNLAVQVYSTAVLDAAAVADTNAKGLGSATVSVSGGVTPYTYLWSDPSQQSTPTATGLSPGVYMVNVVDGHGCSSITTVEVENVLVNGLAGHESHSRQAFVHPLSAGRWHLTVGSRWVGEKVEIFDVLGKSVFLSSLTSQHLPFELNVPSGVYFLKVSSLPGVLKMVKE